MSMTVHQIAAEVGGQVLGDGSLSLSGFAPANSAQPGDLTFAEKESYFAAAEQSQASAILVPEGFTSTTKTLIQVKNARIAMARLLPVFYPVEQYAAGVHPSAIIDATAKVDATAHIGPNVVIGPDVRIGARSVLLGGNHIGRGTQLGDDVTLHPGVIIYSRCKLGHRVSVHSGTIIGADGFGYSFDEGKHRKILQVGDVVIGNDVEIGANSAIDRGALGSTEIGEGTKLDNFVHLAHNVKVGKHSIIMGQVGIAGSTTVGDYTVVASQTGIAGHLAIGSQVTIGAKSGIMRDIPDKSKVLGVPAVADKQTKRQWLAVQQLPTVIQRLRQVEKRLEKLFPEEPEA